MKKSVLSSISLILVILIFVILAGGCISLLTPFIEQVIMQMLDELGEANVNGDVDQIIMHYTDPITEVNHLSEETYVTSLEDKRIELEEMITYYDCLIDDFSKDNEEITILNASNAIVECDEHTKFQDLLDETIYESIDRVRLTLIKVNGNWKISIYELLASEEVAQ
jgi:hypothetical protein